MKTIIKRELKNYMKNPIYWIGILMVILGVYQLTGTYLKLSYFENEDNMVKLSSDVRDWEQEDFSVFADADIQQGYIPVSIEKQIASGCEMIKGLLVESFGLTVEEAEQEMLGIQERFTTVPEIVKYMEEKFEFLSADFYFKLAEYQTGTVEEVNRYIGQAMEEHPYTYYFATKFADFAGLYMGFFAAVILAFLFIRDTHKDTYELLHTKPIRAHAYICGKILGGMAAILLALGILNAVFIVLSCMSGIRAGFPVRFWDIPAATAIYILPNMLMIVCVYTAIALVFRNPLPALPLLLLYVIYSNSGSERFLSITVRFTGKFLNPVTPSMMWMNQVFLIAASAVLTFISIQIWKRRRGY